MKRTLGIHLLALSLAALLAGCGSAPPAPEPGLARVLAPTGKLRVGLYPGSPTSIIPASGSGEARGVGHDVGRDMARRLGVPFEPVVFERNAEVLEAGKAGRVDLVFTNATAERARFLDFSPTVLEIEQGYLVPRGSAIASAADVDRAGVRVGVSQGSTSQGVLSKELKHAAVVPTPNLKVAAEMLSSGKLDAFATNKAILFELGDKVPGSRVLDGRWGLEKFSFGIPKGRDAALPLLGELVAAARADGTVAKAAERAGVRGTPTPGH
ncbi:MAG: transporter substrate-binding domain-containing protein [Burkholderiales bacterium]|nr:transporter substrate-binding domain-containing protein [Burkholderiales bacterium]